LVFGSDRIRDVDSLETQIDQYSLHDVLTWAQVFQIDVRTDTKTKDNVTLTVTTAIQCAVAPDKAHDYYFKLSSPHAQVSSYVNDCIRSLLPTLDLDKAFESKDEMAINVKQTVAKAMEPYGVYCMLPAL
jgi:regulator of protease activity HflC (stomatin/prohibitin superfamily)